MIRRFAYASVFALGLFLAGCQSFDAPSAPSDSPAVEERIQAEVRQLTPFEVLDKYLSYLTPREREEWWQNVKDKGFQGTVSELEGPISWWWSFKGTYHIEPPQGYYRYSLERSYVFRELRQLAQGSEASIASEESLPRKR